MDRDEAFELARLLGYAIGLTRVEASLAGRLIARSGEVVRPGELARVRGDGPRVAEASVGLHLARLREKLRSARAFRLALEEADEGWRLVGDPRMWAVGDLALDCVARRAGEGDRSVELTSVEAVLLALLMGRRGEVVPGAELIAAAGIGRRRRRRGVAAGDVAARQTLVNQVKNLRRKLGDELRSAAVIDDGRGGGYRLVVAGEVGLRAGEHEAAGHRATTAGGDRRVLQAGRLRLDCVDRLASEGDRSVGLTPVETALLALLVARQDEVVSHAELVAAGEIGGQRVLHEIAADQRDAHRQLADHVVGLRRKLGELRSSIRIDNVRGSGYCLAVGGEPILDGLAVGGEPVVHAGELRLDRRSRTASLGGDSVELTLTETRVLAALMIEHGKVVTTERLVSLIVGGRRRAADDPTPSVRHHVSRLARKLRRGLGDRAEVQVVYGAGYRLVVADHVQAAPAGAEPADVGDVLEAGTVRLDARRGTATHHGSTVALTESERETLVILVRAYPRPVPIAEFRDRLAGINRGAAGVRVRRLRRRLHELGGDPPYCDVETVVGVGYRLVVR